MTEPQTQSLPTALLRWPLALADEILRLPDVIRTVRTLITDLAALAPTLAETMKRLDGLIETAEAVDVHAIQARVDALVEELQLTLGRVTSPLDDALRQVASIELTTTELRNAFFSIAGRTPGARGAVRDTVPTSDAYIDRETAGTVADPRNYDAEP